MTAANEELLAEWLLCWEEAHEQGRAVSAAELAGDRGDLVGELARRIEVLREIAWLDAPLDAAPSPGPSRGGDVAGKSLVSDRRGPSGGAAIEPRFELARLPGRARPGSLLLLAVAGCGALAVAVWLVVGRPAGPGVSPEAGGELTARAEAAFFEARYAEADDLLTSVLIRNPDDRRARTSRGISRLKLGRFEEAVADFTAAVEGGPADREALRQRAEAYAYLRQYDAAIADLDHLLAIGHDSEPVRRRRDAIKAVRDAQRSGNHGAQ